ncbi:P-loop containing nucleoside triphosphate hydrolase protein [Mycena pura]|uniref:P-loop containing nucleoside triphosphate hydrolase protein n=1 Tax=Mycena pura TaxID=153505 RepID=A0AAD6Y9I9_9AGAR|nr:P-loop containing nucleoside triphosphate hydrolase protein [Mycena pura]
MEYNNVDRRHATRQVPMEVLGLGFPRTGTASMRIALETLGYRETSHGFTVSANLSEMEMWTEAINAKFFGKGTPYGRAEWDQLLGHCMAVTDAPHMLFAEELIASYPEAKVVLTTRDPERWWTSYADTVDVGLRSPLGKVNAWLEQDTMGKALAFWRLVRLAMFGTTELTPEIAKARYAARYDEVRRAVPKDRLLEYRVGEGWERLCGFLGKPVPVEAFPRVNDTQAFHQGMMRATLPIWRRAAVSYVLPVLVMSILLALYDGRIRSLKLFA